MGQPEAITEIDLKNDADRSDATADIRRLEAAVHHLLMGQLNTRTPGDAGPAGNRRLVAFFLDLLLTVRPAIFLDIGANDGSTAATVKALLPDCAVTAYEANPAIHAMFETALSTRGVAYRNQAVAARTGLVTIFAPRTLSNAYINGEIVASPSIEPPDTGKSSLLKRNENATYDEHRVEAISIDDSLAVGDFGAGRREVALWIDVEGAAYEVLSGAAATLERTAIIFIETENHAFWSGQKQCGDIVRVLVAAGFIPVRRDWEYGDKQFNIVFVHNSLMDLVHPKLHPPRGDGGLDPTLARSAPVAPRPSLPKASYRSLAACLIAEIPVFVPVFNNPTYAANMLRQLKRYGIKNIFVVDNNSNFAGMIDFLDRAAEDATIIRLDENKGPHDLILSDTNFACLPDIFCVTDPDLEFRADMPADFLYDLLNLTNKFGVGKAGLALELNDADRMNRAKFLFGDQYFHIWEWEIQFWRDRIDQLSDGSPIFKANIDTTFALYNKKYFRRENFYDAVRVAGRYSCRHLPWYLDTTLPADEDAAYRATQKFSYHMR